VLGKLGDWVIWFGPYTPAQLVVMGGGALLLIKTFAWWSWLGPVPVVAWLVAIWAVRGARIGGRAPFTAALGLLTLLARHPAGRIGGRSAREKRSTTLMGSFVIEPGPMVSVPSPRAVPERAAARRARVSRRCSPTPADVPAGLVPVSGLANLLQQVGAGQDGRS